MLHPSFRGQSCVFIELQGLIWAKWVEGLSMVVKTGPVNECSHSPPLGENRFCQAQAGCQASRLPAQNPFASGCHSSGSLAACCTPKQSPGPDVSQLNRLPQPLGEKAMLAHHDPLLFCRCLVGALHLGWGGISGGQVGWDLGLGELGALGPGQAWAWSVVFQIWNPKPNRFPMFGFQSLTDFLLFRLTRSHEQS